MNNLVPKSLAPMCIYEILLKYSDCGHPLTQGDIIKHLAEDYSITMERKAVSRHIDSLKEAGFEILSADGGDSNSNVYLIGEFDDSELHLLIDGVLSSRYISAKHSKELIKKLCNLTNRHFSSHVKNVYSVDQWSKTENKQLFNNIAVVDEAIENNKMVTFTYNRYGTDKKLHKSVEHTASPYQFILHNQRYYLMACNEKWNNIGYYRVDRITDIRIAENSTATPLKSLKGYENGINYRQLATSFPYMYTDKPTGVQFYADEIILDQIVDWFGDNAAIKRDGDRLLVHVTVSLNAMEYWVLQYAKYVEVIAPADFRETIKADLLSAIEKYK